MGPVTRSLIGLLVLGCSSEPSPSAKATSDAGAEAAALVPTLTHDFPEFELAAGDETDVSCQQWTPGHTETLYVNWVQMHSDGAFHHMNFFFVPESMLPGPDGTFTCADRGFDQQLAAVAGGVFYAQSTQARDELMKFGKGAALAIPPGFKIVGNQHLLNTAADAVHTHLRFELGTLPAAEVTAQLAPFIFQYGTLDIPGHSRVEFSVTCDLAKAHLDHAGRPIDFGIQYLLPHYHRLGTLMRLDFADGPRAGEVAVETTAHNGESVGKVFDPPLSLIDAQSLRLTCGFDNTTAQKAVWGIGPNEMCILFGFSDSERMWSAADDGKSSHIVGTDAGVSESQATCTVISVPKPRL